jgi:hypothetical protein
LKLVKAMAEDLRTMKKEAQNAYQEHDEKVAELKTEFYGQVGHASFFAFVGVTFIASPLPIAPAGRRAPRFLSKTNSSPFGFAIVPQFSRKQRLDGNLNEQISKNLAYFFTTVILRNPDTHGTVRARGFSYKSLSRCGGHIRSNNPPRPCRPD